MIKKLTNENGSGLVIVMMVLLVLSVLGSSLGMVTINSRRLAEHTQDTNSAYYIAEAGANLAYEELKDEVMKVYGDSESESLFFATLTNPEEKPEVNGTVYKEEVFQVIDGSQPTASIEIKNVTESGAKDTFVIRSTGEIAGKTRVVEKSVNVKWIPKASTDNLIVIPDNAAALVKDGIELRFGPVVGNLHIHNSGSVVTYSGSGWQGGEKVIRDNVINFDSLNKDIERIIKSVTNESLKVTFNQSQSVKLETNYKIKNMHIRGPHNFIIGDKNIILVVDTFQNDWGDNIITGNGTLTIIAKNITGFGSSSFNAGTNKGNLRIIYYPDNQEELSISNNAKIGAQIIAPKSKVSLEGSGHVYGTIISKQLEIRNHGYLTYNKYNFKNEDTTDNSNKSLEDLISSKPATEK